jgi:arylsulfatase A-like enzyme
VRCADLDTGDLPGYGDDVGDNAPVRADGTTGAPWQAGAPALSDRDAVASLRNRARMAQAVDRMVTRILREVDQDTYVVVTSDNGFHLGQHGLTRGKGTAYDSDTRVPLLVTGPGVRPGRRSELVSNLDLAPTFEELAGLRPARYRSGTSLVPTFGDPGLDRRGYTFLEHTQVVPSPTDPDRPFTASELDRVPSYVAVRSRDALLVRLDLDPGPGTDTAWELYDYRTVGWEQRNVYADPGRRAEVADLTARLVAFDGCAASRGDQPVPQRCRELTRAQ